MTRVVFSRRAKLGVDEITEYLAEHRASAAARFRAALARAREQLSRFPNSGSPGIRPGTRRLIVGEYILSYRRRSSDVEIFAVRHARRRDARL